MTIEPASSSVNEVMMKSGVERADVADAKGARLVTSSKATNATGMRRLDRVSTSRGFFEAVNGDRLALPLPLSQQLIEQGFVLVVGDS
jgi:hypothetical protein